MPLPPTWKTLSHPRALAFACCVTACGDDDRDARTPDASFDAARHEDASGASTELDAARSDTHADAALADAAAALADAAPSFAMRVISSELASPWELTFGHDGALWVSERTGKRVTRIDPTSGARTTLLTLDDAYQASGQDGVLGLAIQAGSDFVYLAYTYDADASDEVLRRAKIVRYRFATQLVEPTVLIEDLPASSDHNSGRLALAPDQTLVYALGDQGNNQFERKCEPIRAQELPTQSELDARDWSHYVGKILRLALDGSIPADNPVLQGVRSHVFSYGHRNAQGLAFAADGTLYASEQGPKSDDELNQIRAGGNYGWPYVAGFRDDRAYAYGDWSAAPDCGALTYSDYTLPASVPQQPESAWTGSFVPPLRTFFSVDSDYDFTSCSISAYVCWPTIAPSSLAIYTGAAIPRWSGSFLLTSLKDGAVHRVAGASDEVLFRTVNRYRDLAIASDGRTFYVATDVAGDTRALDGSPSDALANRGAILEFRLR